VNLTGTIMLGPLIAGVLQLVVLGDGWVMVG